MTAPGRGPGPREPKQSPTRQIKTAISEMTREDFESAVSRQTDEFRDILRAAHNGKRLKLECDNYRDARTLAQRLAAARTYVGSVEANVTIRHRGTLIYLAPRQDSVDIDDADGVLVEDSSPKIKATLRVDDKDSGK